MRQLHRTTDRTAVGVPPRKPAPGPASLLQQAGNRASARLLERQEAPPAPAPATPAAAPAAPGAAPPAASVSASSDAEVEALVGAMKLPALSTLRADIQARRGKPGEKLKLGSGDRELDDATARLLLNRIRTVVMERLTEDRTTTLTQATPAGTALSDPAAEERRKANDPATRKKLLESGQPYLDELRKPKHGRDAKADVELMDHKDPKVMAAVRATFGLAIGGGAEAALAAFQKGDTSMKDKALGVVSGQPAEKQHWCGAFAMLVSRGAGAKSATSSMPKTAPEFTDWDQPAPKVPSGSLDSVFSYTLDHTIVVDGVAQKVSAYHKARGSERSLLKLPDVIDADVAAGLDIQPGDIVLVDNARGTYGDHIQVCTGYDPGTGTLSTVGGNEGSGTPQQTIIKAGSRNLTDATAQPAPNDAAKLEKGETKHNRVYARARFSLVDYEAHEFKP
jgi:hypothetical protein